MTKHQNARQYILKQARTGSFAWSAFGGKLPSEQAVSARWSA